MTTLAVCHYCGGAGGDGGRGNGRSPHPPCVAHSLHECVWRAVHKVIGVIDFGDMMHTWRVNDIAITAAYILIMLQESTA